MEYLLLTSAVAIAGPSILWLFKKTVDERHAVWITGVGVPAVLASYSVFAAPAAGVSLFRWSAFLGFFLAVVSGFIFDEDASPQTVAVQSQPRRNTAPLLLWGAGALFHVFAPALGSFVDALSGAVLAVGGGSLVGQAAHWAQRLLNGQRPVGTTPGFTLPMFRSDPRVSRFSGFIAAAIAIWLLLPSINSQTAVEHDNSRTSERTTQPQPSPAERSGTPPPPPLGR